MEGQKLEIPEDPSQTFRLNGRLWAQFCTFCFGNFPEIPERKTNSLAAILV